MLLENFPDLIEIYPSGSNTQADIIFMGMLADCKCCKGFLLNCTKCVDLGMCSCFQMLLHSGNDEDEY